jgi:hypothetical protein
VTAVAAGALVDDPVRYCSSDKPSVEARQSGGPVGEASGSVVGVGDGRLQTADSSNADAVAASRDCCYCEHPPASLRPLHHLLLTLLNPLSVLSSSPCDADGEAANPCEGEGALLGKGSSAVAQQGSQQDHRRRRHQERRLGVADSSVAADDASTTMTTKTPLIRQLTNEAASCP